MKTYGHAVKKPVRYYDDSDMLVKCSNQNCIYFYYQCCGLSQKILKLLNDRNDNYWYCHKPALNVIFMDIYLRKSASHSLLEPRIVDLEKHSINLKSQINNKVDNSVFDNMINESKKKLETFESNSSCLRSEIDNLQLKHPDPMTGDDVISSDSPGYDPEIPNLSISFTNFKICQ